LYLPAELAGTTDRPLGGKQRETPMYYLMAKLQMFKTEQSDRGATAVEYGLMVALIAAVIATMVGFLGDEVNAKFSEVRDAVANA
jgi:pilus assembly protein Flp/PilA